MQATRNPERVRPRRPAPVDRPRRQPPRHLALVRGARALALLRGRTYATPQDVFDLAPEVLRHRLLLTYDALARDITPDHDRQPDARDGAGDVGVAEAERTAADGRSRRARSGATARLEPGGPSSGRPGPPTEQVAELVRTLELTINRRARRRPARQPPGHHARARQRAGRVPAVPARRRRPPHRLERHRPHAARPTSATRSPTATSRRGSSSTCRRRCASARPSPRSRRPRSSPPRRVGFLTARNQNRLGAVLVAGPAPQGDAAALRARPGARRARRRSPRPPPSEGLGRSDLAGAIDRVAVAQQAARLRRRDLRLRRRRAGSTRSPGSALRHDLLAIAVHDPASSTSRRSGSSTSSTRRPAADARSASPPTVQRRYAAAAAERGRRSGIRARAAPAPT